MLFFYQFNGLEKFAFWIGNLQEIQPMGERLSIQFEIHTINNLVKPYNCQ